MGRLINALAILAGLAVVAGVAWVVLDTSAQDDDAGAIARLTGVYNDVKTRRAGRLVWDSGEAGEGLFVRDAVKTAADARAVVAYQTGLSLNVDPDSLVVITAPRFDDVGREVQEVVVQSGTVSGTVDGPGARQKVVEVLDAEGNLAARLQTAAYSDEPLQYRVRRTGSGTTELAVLRGAAKVAVGDEEVEIAAGQALDVTGAADGADPQAAVIRLPPFPSSLAPGVDARLDLDERPAVVRLDWSEAPGVSRYHVQIGHTFAFDDVVTEAVTEDTGHAFEPPGTGTWYWRVSSIDDQGREGEFGFVRRFSVLSLPGEAEQAGALPLAGPEAVDEAAPEDDTQDLLAGAPPTIATDAVFELVGRVLGTGLTRQKKGDKRFAPIRGKVKLAADDVVEARRGGALRLGRGATLGLESGARVRLDKAGEQDGRKVVALHLEEGTVVADLAKNAALGGLYLESGNTRLSVGGDEGSRARAERLEGKLRLVAERGASELWVGGKRVDLAEGFGLDVPDQGAPGDPIQLPAAPDLQAPDAGAKFLTLDSPPQIAFTWRPEKRAAVYHVVISTDPKGENVVFQGMSKGARLTYAALKPGTYHWTVRSIDENGFESPRGQHRSLTVVRDSMPPAVSLESPMDGDTVSAEAVTVAGRTEADARVKINGKQVTLDDAGRFSIEVKLAPGLNQIVIEAVDRANNVTFENLKVRRE